MISLEDYAKRHGGEVEPCDQVKLLVLHLMRTPPHKLITDAHQYGDGTVLLGRIPTVREDRKGKHVWKETHVNKINVPNPERIPSQSPLGAQGEVTGSTWLSCGVAERCVAPLYAQQKAKQESPPEPSRVAQQQRLIK